MDSVGPRNSAADYAGVRPELLSLIVEPRPAGDGWTRLVVTGELNLVTAPLLTDAVNAVLRDSPGTVIELDLAGVPFLDSAGIRGLLHSRTNAERTGRRLVLVNPTDWVRQVLEATALLAHFGLAP